MKSKGMMRHLGHRAETPSVLLAFVLAWQGLPGTAHARLNLAQGNSPPASRSVPFLGSNYAIIHVQIANAGTTTSSIQTLTFRVSGSSAATVGSISTMEVVRDADSDGMVDMGENIVGTAVPAATGDPLVRTATIAPSGFAVYAGGSALLLAVVDLDGAGVGGETVTTSIEPAGIVAVAGGSPDRYPHAFLRALGLVTTHQA